MIYTRDLLLRSLSNINPDLVEQIEDSYIGIPQALREAAIEICMNQHNGEVPAGTYDAERLYYASVYVVTEALWQLKRQGFMTHGCQNEFEEKELNYECKLHSLFDTKHKPHCGI